jgi:hypothetical protein
MFHNSPPLVPILSQFNPVHTTPSYLSQMHYNFPATYVFVFLVVSSFCLPHQYPILLPPPPIGVTCPPHLILLYWIIGRILVK